jgi:hypothetical protein
MESTFPTFDRSRLQLLPLSQRQHLLDVSSILPLQPRLEIGSDFVAVADRIAEARRQNAAVVLMMGAHVLRSGVQRYLIDLMERGLVSCLSMNGAGVVHDFEFALIGATTESVADYIRTGQFGLWWETGRINDIVTAGAKNKLAAGWRLGIPITVHVGIGYDIVHELPNCDGAAYGATSYTDFLRFASVLESLQGGVIMNFGSAVMGPEVYLKALSMARNTARQSGRQISEFTTLVCDLAHLPDDYHREADRSQPGYYFRPWKTMLVRTVAGEGESFYVQGKHADTVPQLWTAVGSCVSAGDPTEQYELEQSR